ncbi:Protein CBG16347 [Caenorhabditis briggsae]|uniref:Protein CBG16347 n=1 Tax=Caenorhabditis briggsae TaxID=6238 RepID=A8XNM6_CAEBR|nr:Protein CBG16347 [Caenorhabditis briggsae]CAP34115.2 Protein CBG16347 [Caenorhabditis briggsae]
MSQKYSFTLAMYSLRTTTPGSTEDLIRMRKSIQSKDEKIQQLERMVNDLRKTLGDETERRKSTLATITDTFEAQIDRLRDENYEKELLINELRTERDKYAAMVDKNSGDEALSRMEEIRQKIQERKKKGRLGVTAGGLSEHARTSSGSMMQQSLHRRSSSGSSFDPVPTAPMPYNMFKNATNNKQNGGSYG